jgi:hypothetical protein
VAYGLDFLMTDWPAVIDSVKKLAALRPQVAITGHGTAMGGDELTNDCRRW